jgi:Protein of unknown function (DUF998)
MAQLARPDLARNSSARHDPGIPLSGADPSPAVQSGRPADSAPWQVSLSRPIPGWAVISALLSPTVLIGGWLVAGALQPATYDPVRQTVSVLAGATGTDRWVMTGALLVVGCSQIATGAGLFSARLPARILLMLTGVSTIGIAASPDPASGPTRHHLAFAACCVVTTVVWPLFVVRRMPAQSWSLSLAGGIAMTVIFAGLSGWLLVTATAGGDLGLVERLMSSVQGAWPLVVALALRRSQGSARGAA